MPTLKPRTTVTLEPHTHEVIDRLASIQGRSRGAVISEFLDAVAPALTRTVALLEAAAAAPQQVKDGLRSVVEGVHSDLVSTGGDLLHQLDTVLDGLHGGVQGESDPHVVTRGSGTTDTPGHKPSKSVKKPNKSKA